MLQYYGLISTGDELDTHRTQAGQAFFDIPKCQADSLTARASGQLLKTKQPL